jgi:serine/threonine-protein kinase
VRNAIIGILVAPMVAVGCSSDTNGARAPSQPSPRSKEAVERSAHELDVLAASRQDAKAWAYYSQRCKDKIGSLNNYSNLLDVFFKGRTPKYESATARVNETSAQVVSIDKDPSAPASAMQPRTWTFIDGRWQFDNC